LKLIFNSYIKYQTPGKVSFFATISFRIFYLSNWCTTSCKF